MGQRLLRFYGYKKIEHQWMSLLFAERFIGLKRWKLNVKKIKILKMEYILERWWNYIEDKILCGHVELVYWNRYTACSYTMGPSYKLPRWNFYHL